MKSRHRTIIVSGWLGIAICLVPSADAIESPTLGAIRIAITHDDHSDTSTANDFKLALTRQDWDADVRGATLDDESVREFRSSHPEYEIVVAGTFRQDGILSLTVYWEDGVKKLVPSTTDQPFNAVVAEFVEFVQSSRVQDYVYERRRSEQRSAYAKKLDDAWAQYRISEWSQAKQILHDALRMPEANRDWHPYFLLGHCHKGLEQFEEARENFEKVRDLNSSHSGAVLELGNLEFALGEFSKAKLWYAEAIERGTSNLHRARWNLALVSQILQEWDDAKQHYELLLQQPAYSIRARERMREIDETLDEIKRLKEEEDLTAERRARLLRWLRGCLGIGGVGFATAWVVVLQRRRQRDDSLSAEKKSEFTSVLTQTLVGVWSGLLTAFAMTFFR